MPAALQVAVLSTFHYVNHGGSEFVVYRATPADVESGVRVGNIEYPGYPASAVGIKSDPALRVAFFALLFDQDLNTTFQVYARDPAGNEALSALDHQVFPKPYSRSRIEIDDRFMARVVPAIASNSPQEKIPTDDPLDREVPYDQGETVARALPDARLEPVRGAGHSRLLRDPAIIGRVTTFVANTTLDASREAGNGRATAEHLRPAAHVA